jgi:hypothetical protein
MKRVLAGPTFEGSYVMSVLVPIPPRLSSTEDGVLFEDADETSLTNAPFERQVTRFMHQALRATHTAVLEAQTSDVGIDAFVSRETQGISANLCDALVAFGGQNDREFDIEFGWAIDRPFAIDPEPIRFPSDFVPVLREASRDLRARIPETDIAIRGNVVRLHRESNLGGGEVTVAGVIVDDEMERSLKVVAQLAEAEYEDAISAHQTFLDVELVGSLIRRGNRTYLQNISRFAALPAATSETRRPHTQTD